MPNITDEQLNDLLQNIPDEALRAHYQMIASGQIKAEVYCLTTGRQRKDGSRPLGKPVKIGEQMPNDAWVSTSLDTDTHGLQSYRHRFDGLTGFNCTCGNRSIVAAAETEHISGKIPSRADLEAIHQKLQKNHTAVNQRGNVMDYDGFRVVQNANTLVGVN